MKKLIQVQPPLGCDPEFFFRKRKTIVGAEKIIPSGGIESVGGKVIIDGVQAELNPTPSVCRMILGDNIALCFMRLARGLATHKGIQADFSQTVKVSKRQLNTLDPKYQKFGCMPSKNTDIKSESKEGTIDVNPLEYKNRSAGGHIHIGRMDSNWSEAVDTDKAISTPDILVPLLDAIVGNTFVLIDRDEGNVERRKLYGRAGEYRTPPHGLEYRTLSNIWLRSYQVMSLATGLCRHAVMVLATGQENADAILNAVPRADIVKAINENDFALALKNYKKIMRVLLPMTPSNHFFPITRVNKKQFDYFVEKGIDHWFPQSPLKHWTRTSRGEGFNDFLRYRVAEEMELNK